MEDSTKSYEALLAAVPATFPRKMFKRDDAIGIIDAFARSRPGFVSRETLRSGWVVWYFQSSRIAVKKIEFSVQRKNRQGRWQDERPASLLTDKVLSMISIAAEKTGNEALARDAEAWIRTRKQGRQEVADEKDRELVQKALPHISYLRAVYERPDLYMLGLLHFRRKDGRRAAIDFNLLVQQISDDFVRRGVSSKELLKPIPWSLDHPAPMLTPGKIIVRGFYDGDATVLVGRDGYSFPTSGVETARLKIVPGQEVVVEVILGAEEAGPRIERMLDAFKIDRFELDADAWRPSSAWKHAGGPLWTRV